MIRQFIILLSLSLLSLSVWGNTSTQQRNERDDIVSLPDGSNFVIPSFEQVDTEREIGKGIVHLLDSLSKAPSFAAKDFENLACFLIDDLLSRNYLLAAGMGIHRAYNILLDPKIASEANLVGLTTSAAELYMRGGAFDNAVNYLDLTNQLCNHYGEPANENYIRNSFNIA
ncbi:MAG: hypothetical protein K2M10_03450, partial [Muribaculaceae bacterium]|nr:hypothetical protein [Muribaculaceae bacterium]